MELEVEQKIFKEMLSGKVSIDYNTLDFICAGQSSEFKEYFDSLDLSKINTLPFHAIYNEHFKGRAVSLSAFCDLLNSREDGISWRDTERKNLFFHYKDEINHLNLLMLNVKRNKLNIKISTLCTLDVHKIKNDKITDKFFFNKCKDYFNCEIKIKNININEKDNLIVEIKEKKKNIFDIKKRQTYSYLIPDDLSYYLVKENFILLGKDEVISRGEILNLSDDVLNGKIPVTPSILHYLIVHHRKYDLTKLNVSKIKDFSGLCGDDFNQDISNWDVSSGEDFGWMFGNNKVFSQDLSRWNVSNGKRFKCMFTGAINFDFSCINNWDLNNAVTIMGMIGDVPNINCDLSKLNANFSRLRYDHDAEIFYSDEERNYELKNMIPVSKEVFLTNRIKLIATSPNGYNIINQKRLRPLYLLDHLNEVNILETVGVLNDFEYFHLNYTDNSILKRRLQKEIKEGAVLIEKASIDVHINDYLLHFLFRNEDLFSLKDRMTRVTLYCLLKIDNRYYQLTNEQFQDLKSSGIFE